MFGFCPKIEKLFLKIENFRNAVMLILPKQLQHPHPMLYNSLHSFS